MHEMSTPQVRTWFQHISVLAGEIGPRGSTTEKEREAAYYVRDVFARLGLTPTIETFRSATSGYQPFILTGVGMVLSFLAYRVSPWLGAGIILFTFLSLIAELLFWPNPLRWLISKGASQNVFATLDPAGEHRGDLIILAHLDTNRTPIFFARHLYTDIWRVTTPLTFLSFIAFSILYVVGAITGWEWVWTASITNLVLSIYLIIICVQAELSPYSPGANDNASAVGLMLTVAEHFRREPLQHTRVWFVGTGCEEVKHYGAIDFLERHMAEFVRPRAVVFEMLGRDGPGWVSSEMIVPPFAYYADPAMVRLIQQVSDTNPDWNATPTRVFGGHTEMADPLRMGIPAVALIGLGPDGVPLGYKGPVLYWHRIDDTPDKIDHAVLERTWPFALAYLHALDGELAGERVS